VAHFPGRGIEPAGGTGTPGGLAGWLRSLVESTTALRKMARREGLAGSLRSLVESTTALRKMARREGFEPPTLRFEA
jgi:hypothetical protein